MTERPDLSFVSLDNCKGFRTMGKVIYRGLVILMALLGVVFTGLAIYSGYVGRWDLLPETIPFAIASFAIAAFGTFFFREFHESI